MVEQDPYFLYAIRIETLGGLLPVSNVWLQDHLQSGLLDGISIAVYLSFFFVPQTVVVYLWATHGPFARYVAAACGLFGAALVIHFLLPTAPPWMASEGGLIPPLDRSIIRVLSGISPSLTAGGYEASANDVAAMPSVHQGLTVLAAIAMASHRPRTRWVAWLYGLGMLFAIAYLGEHYVVDGALGAGMAWVAWWLTGRSREEKKPVIPL
jgi:membrane-associated phospholipid phosphatase